MLAPKRQRPDSQEEAVAEREVQRLAEAEARLFNAYEAAFNLDASKRHRVAEGKVVVKGSQRPWEQTRQGRLKHFLHSTMTDTADICWRSVFIHDIRTHSGRHRHQGGLAIYVIEGKGWTVVDGIRHDWEEGDLILLPVKPGGLEHQHFNAEPGKPCMWLGMIYAGFWDALGNEKEQKEVSPDWR